MIAMYIAYREYEETIKEWDRKGLGSGKSFEELLWDDSRLRNQLFFKYDPILANLESNWEEFQKLGAGWSMSSVSEPDAMTALRENRSFDKVGCRYIVKGGELSIPVITTVWVRNFAGEEMYASLDVNRRAKMTHLRG